MQQTNAVVVRPTSSIVLHSPPHILRHSSSPAATDNRTPTQATQPLRSFDNNVQTTSQAWPTPLSPAVDARSPVDEADDMALFGTQPGADDNRVAKANQLLPGDQDHRLQVRQKRSEDSEFDNVDALDVDEERLARVRTAAKHYFLRKKTETIKTREYRKQLTNNDTALALSTLATNAPTAFFWGGGFY